MIALLFPAESGFTSELKKLNWSSFLLAIAIVGIEFGFLLVYSSGWEVGIAAVLTNVVASLILVPVAIFLFKDKLNWVNVAGILVCLVGLVMLNWKK
jgi:multidrug transporter EmrE-like cation transporter